MEGTTLKQRLGLALKRRRVALGPTQAELGKKVGKHRTNCSDIERGRTDIRIKTLRKLCAALDTRIWEVLLEAEGLPEPATTSPPAACQWAACPYRYAQAGSSGEPGGNTGGARPTI